VKRWDTIAGTGSFLAWLLTGIALAGAQVHPAQLNDAVCGVSVAAQAATLDSSPIVQAIHTKGDVAGPAGAACFAKADSATTWITVAAVIRSSDTRETFIQRFGAITQLLGVQYWSRTQQKWRPWVSAGHPRDRQCRAYQKMGDYPVRPRRPAHLVFPERALGGCLGLLFDHAGACQQFPCRRTRQVLHQPRGRSIPSLRGPSDEYRATRGALDKAR
jgi:hypothetical protein